MSKILKILTLCLGLATLEVALKLCSVMTPYLHSRAESAESTALAEKSADAKTTEEKPPATPSYQNLLPQTDIIDLQAKPDDTRSGFDDEDRSFSNELKAKNFSAMADFAKAIPEYVDVPNPVRALMTSARLVVRMKRTAQGWNPVRIDGDPYLRAIFSESWIYLSKQSQFRRTLEKIDYPSVRFEVNISVLSSLAFDEKPRLRIQGNFVHLETSCKKSTAKEWQLLSAWQNAGGSPELGLNVIGLANYVYEAYKNRNREDPILLRLQQSPAYKAPMREK